MAKASSGKKKARIWYESRDPADASKVIKRQRPASKAAAKAK